MFHEQSYHNMNTYLTSKNYKNKIPEKSGTGVARLFSVNAVRPWLTMELTEALALFEFFFIKHSSWQIGNDNWGARQVIMALILWAIDVLHFPRQRDAIM
jgi:hypothetical protein